MKRHYIYHTPRYAGQKEGVVWSSGHSPGNTRLGIVIQEVEFEDSHDGRADFDWYLKGMRALNRALHEL